MREELLKGLTEEQVKKVKACKSSDEILSLAKAEGVELSEEQLEAVSGGGCGYNIDRCGKCGSKDVYCDNAPNGGRGEVVHKIYCRRCGYITTYNIG